MLDWYNGVMEPILRGKLPYSQRHWLHVTLLLMATVGIAHTTLVPTSFDPTVNILGVNVLWFGIGFFVPFICALLGLALALAQRLVVSWLVFCAGAIPAVLQAMSATGLLESMRPDSIATFAVVLVVGSSMHLISLALIASPREAIET
jgi:hypothetical protein